ncbi:Succinate dehydrogenase cytochrome B subunit, mitochondrial [Ceratocystis fimbriata CBS 114723]|uniref:Succinate dehydrogenase cytochrome B subunit, mitochondrial n=1 Tax=Ceratocystis fimbriata CBS 114723 TaxID=1035309 RepID=A0A2C5WYC4_9PEZI|nr:Succinate dehydrogenase cytochrome B subunit, mitochondrial [Ceratocystis fimbriata CBS 114723]
MAAPRMGLTALRASMRPSLGLTQNRLPQILLASAMSTSASRPAAVIEKTSIAQSQEILDAQRLHRPVSPHLTVYSPKQTFFTPSIWHRMTGSILSGSLYAFSTAYLAAPLFGWHLESASLVACAAGLPLAVKGGLKFFFGFPFVFHFINGIRHLTYDVLLGFSKPQIKKFDVLIWSSSTVVAAYLAFLY